MSFFNVRSNVYIVYNNKEMVVALSVKLSVERDSRDSSLYRLLIKRRQLRESGSIRFDFFYATGGTPLKCCMF